MRYLEEGKRWMPRTLLRNYRGSVAERPVSQQSGVLTAQGLLIDANGIFFRFEKPTVHDGSIFISVTPTDNYQIMFTKDSFGIVRSWMGIPEDECDMALISCNGPTTEGFLGAISSPHVALIALKK